MQITTQAPALGTGLSYAPPLLPDELLYSWLARLAALNTVGAPRDALQLFFGCRTLVPSVDLPTRLITITKRIGSLLPFTNLDELLENGTLLPYHRPFLTEAIQLRLRHTLLHGDGSKGLKTLIGRVANRFGAHPALRSCPDCMADSWSRHGSLYWMRRHQLPGVNCCVIHGVLLQRFPLQANMHRQRLLLPKATREPQRAMRADVCQLHFAQLSQELVDASLPAINHIQRVVTYRQGALALGYGNRRGGIDYPTLANALRWRFDDFEGFDHQARLLATTAHPLGWLRPLFERPQRSLHPICHILLIDFLFGSVRNFAKAYSNCDSAPQALSLDDRSPDQAPVSSVSLSALAVDHEATLLDPSLSCRQAAKMIDLSVTSVVALRRARNIPIKERRKSLHPTVINRVLIALSTLSSLPGVAAQTGVSLSSVYRILSQYPATPRPHQDKTGIGQLPIRRASWEAALLACSTAGRGQVTEARGLAGADYAWLYRHDRAWLTSTTGTVAPHLQRSRYGSRRVNWAQRDAELCCVLQDQLCKLRDETPPRRLTKTSLLRPLGDTMVRRNLNQLPQLGTLLAKVVESELAFGVRRIDYAISLLISSGGQLRMWRIQRLAGLRQWSLAHSTYANQQIDRLNAQNSLRPNCLS